MIIDFHTHMFPDKIAKPTVDYLHSLISWVTPATDGTYEGLKAETENSGVDISVVLPIATKPKQFHSINEFASNFQEGNIISFGSIHPDTEDYKEKLRQIKGMGMKGIKLHPDYQEVYFNDIRYKRIVSYASELGLIVCVHAGQDPKSPHNIHCTPKMSAELIKDTEPDKLVLAHMGGNLQWDDVEKYLVGKHVYFDTGVVLGVINEAQFLRIVRNHGVDKIVFGTDSPWGGQREYVQIINQMSLTEEERQHIFYKNACQLLNI